MTGPGETHTEQNTGPDDFETHREAAYQRTLQLRNETWNRFGKLDDTVISFIINPGFMGGSMWPGIRQAYVASRRSDAVLLATDGLADPYTESDAPRVNGHGVEYYAITTDPELVNYEIITDLAGTWLYTLVSGMAELTCQRPGVGEALDRFGTMSVELNPSAIPDEYRDTFVTSRGGVGALINLTDESTVPAALDGPWSTIRLVNLKLLTAAETDFIATGDPQRDIANRGELVERLRRQGDLLVSSLRRPSVV